MSYEAAVDELKSPQTWCKGAKALAKLGDRRALIPLVEAYGSPVEASKRCLLDAMEELGARDAAAGLYEKGTTTEQRWRALHLMRLFESDAHLPILMRAITDANADIRAQARQSIVNQEWTDAWEKTMIQLLDSRDADARKLATESLTRRDSDSSRAALQTHRQAGG